ncbi:MAG: hypothetical protein RQ967_03375 [Candidatus Caldipriscus sp.]|nr:hypothetical protein [Candidatus Caldipriscus sp.]
MIRFLITLGVLLGNFFLSNFHNHTGVFESQYCPAYILSLNPQVPTEIPDVVLDKSQDLSREEENLKVFHFCEFEISVNPSTRAPPLIS